MFNAGLPTAQFGFHSMRSGFLACSIMANNEKSDIFDGILSKTAVMNGWEPQGRVQLGYIK